MLFRAKQRRQPTINIVTLIDILAIILIFYVITTTFKREEAVVIESPDSKTAQATEGPPPTLVYLTKDGRVFYGDDPLPLAQLSDRLKTEKTANPDLQIAFKADKNVPLGLFIKVVDAFNENELGNVKVITEPVPGS